jgi:large subunit ribosomal protein L4
MAKSPTKKTVVKKTPVKKTVAVKKPAVKKVVGLTIPVYDLNGKETSKATLPKEIFSTEASDKLLAQYVRVYMANKRQGNASTKTRAQVKASTRKIYRQKGTGRARHGAKSAPIFVGGGVAFGPKSKDYSLKLNKKQKRKAFFYALSLQYKDGNVIGLVDKALEIEPKTKNFSSWLKSVSLTDKKVLLVLPEGKSNNLTFASRNIVGVTLSNANSLNTYDVLNTEKIIFVQKALDVLQDHFLKTKHEN